VKKISVMTKEKQNQISVLIKQIAPAVKVEIAEYSANNRVYIYFANKDYISASEFDKVHNLLNALSLHYWIEADIKRGIYLSVM
jgi:hypothetical protein